MSTASGHTSAIRARKVLGQAVEDTSGKKIGEIEDIVLDKLSNNVMFAVVGFGGFLGMGDRYHPLPWHVLTYDTGQGGYVIDLDPSMLEGAPTYGATETPNWSDRRFSAHS